MSQYASRANPIISRILICLWLVQIALPVGFNSSGNAIIKNEELKIKNSTERQQLTFNAENSILQVCLRTRISGQVSHLRSARMPRPPHASSVARFHIWLSRLESAQFRDGLWVLQARTCPRAVQFDRRFRRHFHPGRIDHNTVAFLRRISLLRDCGVRRTDITYQPRR